MVFNFDRYEEEVINRAKISYERHKRRERKKVKPYYKVRHHKPIKLDKKNKMTKKGVLGWTNGMKYKNKLKKQTKLKKIKKNVGGRGSSNTRWDENLGFLDVRVLCFAIGAKYKIS